MRTLLASIASIALLGFATAAHATPIEYSITGTTAPGILDYTVTGTFFLDTTTETFSSVDIVENGTTFSTVVGQGTDSSDTYVMVSAGTGLNFELSTTLGSNPVLCTGNCTDESGAVPTFYFPFSGSIAQVPVVTPSATPEPSSLMLLGTGILGLGGLVRRRFVK